MNVDKFAAAGGHVDHFMPHARNGKTVESNSGYLNAVANAFSKKDNLLPLLLKENMECGLQENQFLAMVEYAVRKESQSDQTLLLRKIKHWLTASPGSGKSHNTFQMVVNYSTDAKILFKYFITKEAETIKKIVYG
jgi:hypothetical protein